MTDLSTAAQERSVVVMADPVTPRNLLLQITLPVLVATLIGFASSHYVLQISVSKLEERMQSVEGRLDDRLTASTQNTALRIDALRVEVAALTADRYHAATAKAAHETIRANQERLDQRIDGLERRLDKGEFPPSNYLSPEMRGQ